MKCSCQESNHFGLYIVYYEFSNFYCRFSELLVKQACSQAFLSAGGGAC